MKAVVQTLPWTCRPDRHGWSEAADGSFSNTTSETAQFRKCSGVQAGKALEGMLREVLKAVEADRGSEGHANPSPSQILQDGKHDQRVRALSECSHEQPLPHIDLVQVMEQAAYS